MSYVVNYENGLHQFHWLKIRCGRMGKVTAHADTQHLDTRQLLVQTQRPRGATFAAPANQNSRNYCPCAVQTDAEAGKPICSKSFLSVAARCGVNSRTIWRMTSRPSCGTGSSSTCFPAPAAKLFITECAMC